MSNTKMIKCPNCGVFNNNLDYCKNCGELISHEKKRALKEAKMKQQQIDAVVYEKENPNLVERLKKHPNIFYKAVGWVLYSVIMVVSAIGAGLAWFIAMVAAG